MQWLDYQPWRDELAGVLDPRQYGIEDLDRIVLSGAVRVWTSPNAIIIAELKEYPRGRTVQGTIAAGDLSEIKKLVPLAEAWGREEGCIAAEIVSRPGWAREMQSAGYAPSQIVIWKDL